MTLFELIKNGFCEINKGVTIAEYLADIRNNMGVSADNAEVVRLVLEDGEKAC